MPTEAIEAETTLQTIIKKTAAYLAEKGDLFVAEAVRAAGTETGKWATGLAVLATFAHVLTEAAHAVAAWLQAVHLPF